MHTLSIVVSVLFSMLVLRLIIEAFSGKSKNSNIVEDIHPIEYVSETKRENKKKGDPWVESEVTLVAFIAKYFRLVNKELIVSSAYMTGREKSTFLRKVHRMRGIRTGKTPRISEMEQRHYNFFENINYEKAKYWTLEAVNEFGFSIPEFEDLINSSKRVSSSTEN